MNVAGPPISGGKMLVTSSTFDMSSAVGDRAEAVREAARVAHVAFPGEEHQKRPEAVTPVAPARDVIHPLAAHFDAVEERVIPQVFLGKEVLRPVAQRTTKPRRDRQ